jgi:hypothetical protein
VNVVKLAALDSTADSVAGDAMVQKLTDGNDTVLPFRHHRDDSIHIRAPLGCPGHPDRTRSALCVHMPHNADLVRGGIAASGHTADPGR